MLTNRRITDILTRHQIYFEGVKNYEAAQFNGVMRKLADAIKLEFAGIEAKTLDALTKAQIKKLIQTLRERQNEIFSQYTKEVIARLEKVVAVELAVSRTIYRHMFEDFKLAPAEGESAAEAKPPSKVETLDGEPLKKEGKGTPFLPLLMLAGSALGLRRLWTAITNAPLPSNGFLPLNFLSGMTLAAGEGILRTVMQGYANRSPVAEVQKKLVGTTALKNKDGQISKIHSQASAATDTLLQHITSIIQAGVASVYFEEYEWQSVIDAVTTDICRERNGNVYVYGEGPLPPAHIRCRSKAVPTVGQHSHPPTFFAWIKSQPEAVQNDILGKDVAEQLRQGKLAADAFRKYTSDMILSPDDFARKLGIIVTR